ncbi:E3 ubiquitin-protein ligase MYLIP-like isoform X2 [Physella acuta]|nr:E3 ubiquitin-protein ligase MYLIP-like isoform X2 [Physella acuta]
MEDNSPISILKLADFGFRYTGERCVVECQSCRKTSDITSFKYDKSMLDPRLRQFHEDTCEIARDSQDIETEWEVKESKISIKSITILIRFPSLHKPNRTSDNSIVIIMQFSQKVGAGLSKNPEMYSDKKHSLDEKSKEFKQNRKISNVKSPNHTGQQEPNKPNKTPCKQETRRPKSLKLTLLQQENTKLAHQLMCKVCRSEPVRDLFLPCGHLYACSQCSQTLSLCPACGRPILATVTTFFT